MKLNWIVVICLVVVTSLRAQTTQPSNDQIEPYFAKGRVVNSAGEPIAGVTINMENEMFAHSHAQAKTDKDGRYRIKLTEGSWRPSAQIWRVYNNVKYHFDLCPDPADEFAGPTGAVVNYTWQMSGPKPENLIGNWGYRVIAELPNMNFDFQQKDVELTLVPDGPLADGSAGKTIKGKCQHTGDGWGLDDVPFGRYKISATLKQKGEAAKPLAIRVRNSDDEFGQEAIAQPISIDHTDTVYKIEVEIKLP